MTRKQKIEFLKKISQSKTSIDDLREKEIELWIGYGPDGGNLYVVDGRPVSKEIFDAKVDKIPKPWYPQVQIGDIILRQD